MVGDNEGGDVGLVMGWVIGENWRGGVGMVDGMDV